ncbi:MAG TPA: phospholipase D family protein [Chloroflexota bacterium]|nr:phospholipase D family protein [Chloroflexota bacterium]
MAHIPPIVRRLAGRQIRRALAPIHRRQGRRMRARVRRDLAASRPERSAWWGDDPHWYPVGTPPRQHNQVTALVHGETYFAALLEALNEAQQYVYVIGWCLTPHLPLQRKTTRHMVQSQVVTVLQETARRVPVRVLLWSGARVLFEPRQELTQEAARILEGAEGSDLQCRLDTSAHFSHCHHQKAIVIDGRIAFVGGMDLTTLQGDRWDTEQHPLRAGPNWHDAQVRIEGEAVADVEHNFRQRWRAVTGDDTLPHQDPQHEAAWHTPVQIVRTIARRTYKELPHGEYGIHHAYTRTLRAARRLIYLENQYLWSPEVLAALVAAMNTPHEEPFRIVIVLPASAYDGKFDNDQHVKELLAQDAGRGIVSVYCPYAWGPSAGTHAFHYHPIYVHAKVAIVDDEWLIVGSANLNDRGLITDSEICTLIHDQDLARDLRLDLWAEHLGMTRDRVAGADVVELIDREWTGRAADNKAAIQQADRPLVGTLHRYEGGRMPGSWLLEEAEALTVEH